jgi:hypothetical protein
MSREAAGLTSAPGSAKGEAERPAKNSGSNFESWFCGVEKLDNVDQGFFTLKHFLLNA